MNFIRSSAKCQYFQFFTNLSKIKTKIVIKFKNANFNNTKLVFINSLIGYLYDKNFSFSQNDTSQEKNIRHNVLGTNIKKNDHLITAKIHEMDNVIRNACMSSELKVSLLIKCLANTIQVACKEYRQCITQQILILTYGLYKDKEKYMEELTQYKTEGNVLKNELEKYRSLMEYVEQITLNLTHCLAAMDNLNDSDLMCKEYEKLQRLHVQQMNMNKICESRLSELNASPVL